MTRRVSASIATCRLVEYRYFFDGAASRWSLVGTKVPSTIAIWSIRRFADRGRRQQRADGVDHPVGRGVRHTEQGPDLAHREVGPPVGRDQQHPVGQVQPPLTAGATVGDLLAATLGHDPHELAELAGFQARERNDPLRPGRRDHLHHTMIDDQPPTPITGLRDIP